MTPQDAPALREEVINEGHPPVPVGAPDHAVSGFFHTNPSHFMQQTASEVHPIDAGQDSSPSVVAASEPAPDAGHDVSHPIDVTPDVAPDADEGISATVPTTSDSAPTHGSLKVNVALYYD